MGVLKARVMRAELFLSACEQSTWFKVYFINRFV